MFFRRLAPLALLLGLAFPAGRPEAEEQVQPTPDSATIAHDHVAALVTQAAAGESLNVVLPELDAVVRGLAAEVRAEGPFAAPTPAAAELLSALTLRSELLGDGGLEGYRATFIGSVAPGAMFADLVADVPASITVAQAIIESGWGRSAPGFNLFGMKGEGTAGSEVRRVVEYRHGHRSHRRAAFRKYQSFAESIVDHARVLATGSRYEGARAVAEEPAAYARALQGRYATDPHYASKLLDISARYDLARFDWAVAAEAVADAANAGN